MELAELARWQLTGNAMQLKLWQLKLELQLRQIMFNYIKL